MPRPTIMFAQELGGGFGHLTRLIAVARHFPDARRIFVSPHSRLARPVVLAQLGEDGECAAAPYLQAPPLEITVSEINMAEILSHLGFADDEAVWTAVTAWGALLDQFEPDLVVADYAPTLRIAAAGRLPHLVVGNGFSIPPDATPAPPFRPGEAVTGKALEAEARVLGAANRARGRLDRPALPRLTSLLHGDETFVTNLREIDPFSGRRTTLALPPLNVPAVAIGPALRHRTGPHVFGYLDADAPPTNAILTALNGLAHPSRIFVRNIDPHVLARHCASQVEVCTTLADLSAVLPQTRLVIHYGQQGTAGAALLAGTPQLSLPVTLENNLTSESLRALGVAEAVSVDRETDPAVIRGAMEHMLRQDSYAQRARSVAMRMHARHTDRPERPVIRACRAVLARTQH